MRGRDIKRFGYNFAELYLICTFPSKQYDIDDYPAIKEHLLSFGKEKLEQTGKNYVVDGKKIKSRKKTSNKWFETQDSISYWDDFSKQVICWQRITKENIFCLTKKGMMILDSMAFISCKDEIKNYLLAILNSSLISFWINKNVPQYGNTGYRLSNQFVELTPIPLPSKENLIKFDKAVQQLKSSQISLHDIDIMVMNLYKFSDDEISYILEKRYL